MPKDITIYELYINYHNEYSKKYGNDTTIVLMQVGSFYECYGTEGKGPNLLTVSKVTGMARGRKNKTEGALATITSPYFLGFPITSSDKFIAKLLEENFTVIIIDQVTYFDRIGIKEGGREERKVTQVLTKGTYIENLSKKESNFIACIYISDDPQKPTGSSLTSVGLAGVDVSTGHIFVHEAYSNKYDPKLALDEASRFIKNLVPQEILVYHDDNTKPKKGLTRESIMNYLDVSEKSCRYKFNTDNKYHKLNVQNEILGTIYPTKNTFTPIENLDLEKNIFTIISLILLIDFIHTNNPSLLSGLSKPKQFFDNTHLILGNNAIRQLDVIENSDKDTDDAKFKSVFHVVNQTSTALGQRYLRDILLSPLTKTKDLNTTYDLIETLLTNDAWKPIEFLLDEIKDIERLQRKIEITLLRPYEYPSLLTSYEKINELINLISTNKTYKNLRTLLPSSLHIESINKFIAHSKKIFNLDELYKYSLCDIKTNIFNENIHPDLDKLQTKLESSEEILENLRQSLDNIIRDAMGIKSKTETFIKLRKNNREGHYLLLTKARYLLLQKGLAKTENIDVNGKQFKSSDLIFSELGTSIKLKLKTLQVESQTIKTEIEKIEFLNKKYFLEELHEINKTYHSMFLECNISVTKLDYIKSGAKLAAMYNYVRPTINEKPYGYVKAKKLRHPLIERNIKHAYVPHDVTIGRSGLKGMLIYGINGAGKSVLMKAIGLSIILAQAGLFVPAQSFTFSPYDSLFARITGSDNIFRGWSSFTLEMVELNAILKRNGPKTLIIGDEVCRGTEHISGTAIIAASILELAETQSSFIFATHLHGLMDLDEIKELENVKPFHIFIEYDAKTDSFICDRVLKDGSGPSVYGLEVARHIIQNNKFIDRANAIQTKLLHKYEGILSGKTSRYNGNVLVYKCHVCGKGDDTKGHVSPLETHHINFQKDCENGFIVKAPHIKMNHESNLVVLCEECHNRVHKGALKIEGWKNTSRGNTLVVVEEEE